MSRWLPAMLRRKHRSTFADNVRRTVMLARGSEGPKDRLLEKRLLTFGDDAKVELFAGDIRQALRAARDDNEEHVHPDRFRLDYDWVSGRLKATDGRARFRPVGDAGLLAIVGYVLGRIREDDRRLGTPPVGGDRLPRLCGDGSCSAPVTRRA